MKSHAGIADAIGVATGRPFTATSIEVMGGGDISQAFSLGSGEDRYFVKANRAERLPMFEAEAEALKALTATNCVRMPQPVCWGIANGEAFLVLEYLELRGHGNAAMLGEQLACLHRAAFNQPGKAQFGWAQDNWIGSTPQPNGWLPDWVAFWRDRRLGFQMKLAAEKGYGGALQRDGEALLSHMAAFFDAYSPAPSLLHGDLWGGNHGFLAEGSYDLSCPSEHGKPDSSCGVPVIFDPAVYVGDRECDLAMSELFGGFAPDFYAAYREAWPLDPGYGVRKTLYNLYHILNHANLFGGAYAAQAHRMVLRLLAELR